MSLNRKVHLIAAIILATGLIGQNYLGPLQYLPYLVLFGLTLDALTGFCPMRYFLTKLGQDKKSGV